MKTPFAASLLRASVAEIGQIMTPELMMLMKALLVAWSRRCASCATLSIYRTTLAEKRRRLSATVATYAKLRVYNRALLPSGLSGRANT